MLSIKQCDAFLAKHHQYVSPFVLAIALIVTLDLVTPTMLLAQTSSSTPPPDSNIIFCDVLGRQATKDECGLASSQQPGTNIIFCDSLGRQTTKDACPAGNIQQQPQVQPNNQFQPNQQQQMMPQQGQTGNFNQGPQMGGQQGNYGPSEEQMNKEQARNEAQQAKREAQQLKQMKQGMRGMEQGIKMFQKQIARLTKQGITVPAEIAENITKITTLMQTLKATDNFQDAQDQMQELPDLMDSLNEQRMTLEKLSRWPQTLKQADRTVKQLDRSLTQNKSLAARLSKKGYDISELVAKFESGVQTMKDSRAKAIELIKTDPDSAFDEIENNLFEQMDDLMQSDRTIKELGNLSAFNSSFKRGIAEGQSMINKLKRMKIDTTDLVAKLAELKAKATEINAVIKQKPIDADSIVGIFEELDWMRQDFQSATSELMGDSGNDMPWESGPQQFKKIDTRSLNKFMPQQGDGSGQGFGGSQSGGSEMKQPQMAPGTF